MNCGKVEEPSSSPSQYLSTARFAATSAILTATLSRSDRALPSPTVNTRAGWDVDSAPHRCASTNSALNFEQLLALTSKGVPDGRHKRTERDHARDRACRLEHA